MLRREQGWSFDGTRPDIWEAVDQGGSYLYYTLYTLLHIELLTPAKSFLNRISDTRQADEPPSFYGGIIADPMGLGKTLTMIALIASDVHSPTFGDSSTPIGVNDEKSCGLTLVIVPPACECSNTEVQEVSAGWIEGADSHLVLGTWEHELKMCVIDIPSRPRSLC